MSAAVFEAGNYRYVPGPFQYSGGVAAQPGFEMERVRLRQPLPVREGFALIEEMLTARGRPLTAFAACEMRSPEPFTEQGFIAFNREYVQTLARWGIFHDDVNPVARSNVCPELHPPAEPCFEAFSFTVPRASDGGDAPSFVVAGSGEAVEGAAFRRRRRNL